MCDFCGEETIGEPMVSGNSIPLICEHCGGSLKRSLDHGNLMEWARAVVAVENRKKGLEQVIRTLSYL